MDVSVDNGASYGGTLVRTDQDKTDLPLHKVHAQLDVDWRRFRDMFLRLMTSPTPGAKDPQMQLPMPAK